jgi:hypothetical protein
LIQGDRPTNLVVYINSSDQGVSYPSQTRWQAQVPLFLGQNVFQVQSYEAFCFSSSTQAVARRRLIGDVNDNRVVDDIDLSLFTRLWNTNKFDADFNEDGMVDDFDLSLLVAHWGDQY